MTNERTADSIAAAAAHDRYLAELRSMPAPIMPAFVRRSIPSRGPRKAQKKPIR